MNDKNKTKEQLLDEVKQLSRRVEELEKAKHNHKSAEQALRESEDRIRSIVETSKDWIWEINAQGIHVYTNPAVEAILGYRPVEIIGNLSLDLMHKDDRKLVEAKLPEWIAKKCGWQNHLLRWKHKQGGFRYLESNAVPILNADGDLSGFRGVDRDITERKQAEETLKLFQSAVAASTDAVGMSTPDGRHYYQNEAFDRMFGEVGEDPPATLFVDESVGREVFQTIMAGEQWIGEVRMNGAGGKTLNIFLRAYALKSEDGRIKNLIGVHTDITDRTKAEALIHAEKEFTDKALDAQLDTFFLFDPATGKSKRWNKAFREISGYTDEEIARMPAPISYYSPKDLERAGIFIQKVMEEGTGTIELEFILKDGRGIPTEYRVSVVYDDKGEPKYLISIGRDITDRKQAEQALHESEQRYRTLAEAAFEGMVITDRGKILVANLRFAEILGYEHDEVIGRMAIEFVYPEDRELVAQNIQLENEGPYEHRSTRKDGTVINLEIQARKTRYEGQDVRITAITDITERKQAEEKLKKWAHLFEHAKWGVVISSRDGKRQELMNPAYAKMHGYTVEELSGKPVSDVYTPQGQKELPEILRLMSEKGHHSFEADHVRKDGSVFPALINATEVKDENGNFLYRIVNVQDITNRKLAEQQLHTERDYSNKLIESSPTFFVTIDAQGRTMMMNDSMLNALGYSQTEVKNQDYLSMFVPKRDQEALAEHFAKQLIRGEPTVNENSVLTKDGREILVEWHGCPVFSSQGTVDHFFGIGIDITDRKQAEKEKVRLEEQLHQSQKMEAIGRLAGGVAHDFNNLLTGITGYTEMIQASLDTGDPMFSDLEEVRKAAERAAGLTSQLLAFSRKQIIAPEIIQPNDVLQNSQNMLKRIIGEDINFVFKPEKKLWSIKANTAQLDQILVNLAVNARDAMPNGGKVTMETQNVTLDEHFCRSHAGMTPGDYVMLAVTDNGHGMNAETTEHIFEPFFSTKSKDQGTGLGLSTVYGIMKQNNGFISVYSEPGEGTTFKNYFPAVMKKAEKVSRRDIGKNPTGSETVLLVEDEDMVRKLARKILEMHGYNLIEKNSGPEAISYVNKYKTSIDLLLTDVIMPGMNGKELQEKLMELYPGLKVLFMSGYTENAIAHHGVLDEDIQFLQKPFNIESLTRKVRYVLDT